MSISFNNDSFFLFWNNKLIEPQQTTKNKKAFLFFKFCFLIQNSKNKKNWVVKWKCHLHVVAAKIQLSKKNEFLSFFISRSIYLCRIFFSRFDDPKEKQNKKCNIFAIKIMIMENLNLISVFFFFWSKLKRIGGYHHHGCCFISKFVIALLYNQDE